MMKLSNITDSNSQQAYGLELDAMPPEIPDGLREVSIKAEMSCGNMTPDFVTKLVTWRFGSAPKGIHTIVEFENLEPEQAQNLVLVCSNLQVGISFLPPASSEPEVVSKYSEVLSVATKTMLGFKGNASYIFPICNYLEYMAANVISGVNALEPNDEYTNKSYKEQMAQSVVNQVKEKLADVVYTSCGGKDQFEESVKLCAVAASKSIEEAIAN